MLRAHYIKKMLLHNLCENFSKKLLTEAWQNDIIFENLRFKGCDEDRLSKNIAESR